MINCIIAGTKYLLSRVDMKTVVGRYSLTYEIAWSKPVTPWASSRVIRWHRAVFRLQNAPPPQILTSLSLWTGIAP